MKFPQLQDKLGYDSNRHDVIGSWQESLVPTLHASLPIWRILRLPRHEAYQGRLSVRERHDESQPFWRAVTTVFCPNRCSLSRSSEGDHGNSMLQSEMEA